MNINIFEEFENELPTIKDIEEKDNPTIVAHFTNGNWNWYVVGGDKLKNNDYLLFGLVDGIYCELGTFTLKQIEDVSASLTPNFEKIGLYDLLKKLNNKK